MQQVQNSGPLRVKAIKGFYAVVGGQFGVVNPGDVVDLDRGTASMVLSAKKAELTQDTLKRQENYLPERKKNPPPTQQDQLSSLTKAVESLAALVSQLVSAKAEKGTKAA